MKIEFTKMHGAGNDYVYVDCTKEMLPNPGAISEYVSHRRFGIGSDGLICVCKSDVADFKMRMFNADRSEGKMCGNGVRCVAKFVHDKGLTDKTTITLETLSGVKEIEMVVENGEVVGAVLADDNSDYMLITNQGQLIRSSMSDTPLVSRSAAGNILMRMYEGDSVMAIQSIPEDVVENSKKMAEARQKEREELKAEQEAQNSSPSPETALNEKPDETAPENSTDTQTVDSGDNNSDNQ